ncbi:MAG: hypothetical protein ACLP01_25305 [Solirubrobacteraceae bacterium]
MTAKLRATPRLLGRLALELAVLPLRLLVRLSARLAVGVGAIGAVVWSVQLVLWLLGDGNGGGPLSPPLMVLACAAAVPAGIWLHTLADDLAARHHNQTFQTTKPAYDDVDVVYPDEIYEPWESTPYNPAGTIRITLDHDTWHADRAA